MKILRHIGLLLAFLTIALLSYAVAITAKPYSKMSEKIKAAPTLSSFPEQLVSAVLIAEDEGYLVRSPTESVRYAVEGKGYPLTGHCVRSILRDQRPGPIREFIIYISIEVLKPREQILAAYMSNVYLGEINGSSVFGVQQASSGYFSKQMHELLPAEFALLAALIKGPSFYSPIKRPDRAFARRNTVLEKMFLSGVINENEFREAVAWPLPSGT